MCGSGRPVATESKLSRTATLSLLRPSKKRGKCVLPLQIWPSPPALVKFDLEDSDEMPTQEASLCVSLLTAEAILSPHYQC